MGSDHPELLNEILLDKYPQPATVNNIETILKQMRKSICKIYREKNIIGGKGEEELDGGEGSGFFCIIPYNDKKILTLITNYHILDEYIKEYKKIHITMNEVRINQTLHIDDNISKNIYFSKDYDITIIPIAIQNKNIEYLELDEDIFIQKKVSYKKKTIYNISYLKGKEPVVSFGLLNNFDDFNMLHLCNTEKGSSGSPIFNLSNNKVIGIHKAGPKNSNFKFNYGTFLKRPINEFINQIINNNFFNNDYQIINNITENSNYKYNNNIVVPSLFGQERSMSENNINFLNNLDNYSNNNFSYNSNSTQENTINYSNYHSLNTVNEGYNMKKNKKKNENKITLKLNVEKKDLSNKIYFLNDSYQKKFIDKSKIELFINNIKSDYKKYIKPKEKGVYEITLKFKDEIKDCSNMFLGCGNIIDIDLSSFNTTNVKNMSRMFENCYNLTNINFSSLNTESVIYMEKMFCNCQKLSTLNLSSFKTKKVINMHEMFYKCSNLSNLDVSAFDTKNVMDMQLIFGECNLLNKISVNMDINDKLMNEFYKK